MSEDNTNEGYAPPIKPDPLKRTGGTPGVRGRLPFEPTDAQRAKARELAKLFPIQAQNNIAILMGISVDTLQRHFRQELDFGRAEMIASVAAQMVNRAINAEAKDQQGNPVAKGDIEAGKFVLARLGGWSTKVEVTPRGVHPMDNVDLTRLSDEQLADYGRLAAIAEGLDPDEVVGVMPPEDDRDDEPAPE